MIPQLSILIATYNRANILRETLDAITKLDIPERLHAEWIIVDNNSGDNTREVVESFRDRLSIIYLFEPRPGKNCALNKALREVKLGDIVVFIDDDISPKRDWLEQVSSASLRWPKHGVFGGKIELLWPEKNKPDWIEGASRRLLSVGFARHDHGVNEALYEKGSFPYGGNYWVRRAIFNNGRQFPEALGPKGNVRIMGSETSLLRELARNGFEMVYCPKAMVQHRLKPQDLDKKVVMKRALSMGRGNARMVGINYHNLLNTNPPYWYAREFAKLTIAIARLVIAKCRPNNMARVETMLSRYAEIGRAMEALKMAWNGENENALGSVSTISKLQAVKNLQR